MATIPEKEQKAAASIRAWQLAFLLRNRSARVLITAYAFFGAAAASITTAIGIIVSFLNALLSAPNTQQNPKEWVQTTIRQVLNVGAAPKIVTSVTWAVCFVLWSVATYDGFKERQKVTFVIHVQKAGGDPVPDALVTMALSSGVVEPSKFQNGSYSFDKLNVPKEDLGSVNIDVRWHDLHKVQKTLPLPAKFPSSRQLVVTVDLPAGDSPLLESYAILRDQAIDLFLRDLWDAKWNSAC